MDRLEWSRGTSSWARLLSGGRVQRRLRPPNVVHTYGPVGMESRNPSRARLLSGGRVQRRLGHPNVVHTYGPVGIESRNLVVGPTPKWWKSLTAFEAAQRRLHLWTGWNGVKEPVASPTPKWWKSPTAFGASQRRSHLWTGWDGVEEPRRGPDY
ncbi:hypothetical protein JTE90_013798 [Oedothorax gibbosus]|uniref:Uncharacterized protein n=1 Tax=Oedothorax gibbosus TaxID=931172 RepID=A0AAV6VJU0_9ARAC|nr:hypothetical protein JTE90_013798 [Oedothorax gibbosus]